MAEEKSAEGTTGKSLEKEFSDFMEKVAATALRLKELAEVGRTICERMKTFEEEDPQRGIFHSFFEDSKGAEAKIGRLEFICANLEFGAELLK